MQNEERLRRLEAFTELPLMLLALAMVPVLLIPLVVDLAPATEDSLTIADWLIWSAFAVVFGAKVAVAPKRLNYIRTHWLEVAMVVLPFLRPLRVLRLLRFARLATLTGLNVTLLRRLAASRGTRFALAVVVVVLVLGATGVWLAERDNQTANIRTYGDSLWWATTTMTTVGYGDHFPTTAAGKGIAVALMLVGISGLSVLTATIAAFLVREREEVEMSDLMRKLDELQREVASLRAEQDTANPRSAGPR